MILFESSNQGLNFVFLFLVGFFAGFVFDLSRYIFFLVNKNKVVEKFLDCISVCACGVLLYLAILFFNYGQFRFYLLIAFLLGLLIQRFTIGKIIAKVAIVCYTFLTNIIKKIFVRKVKKDVKDN